MNHRDRIYLSPPQIGEQEKAYVQQAMEEGWPTTSGRFISKFEQIIAEYCGRKHALALNSGTSALHLALLALGIGKNDEVAVQDLTFVATANPVKYVGAQPIFIDSEMDSWNMDPILLEQALEEAGGKIKAVIYVHLYGNPAKYQEIKSITDKYGVYLIEDAAEAIGARYAGQPAGSLGDISILSFNGNKIITAGTGGMLLTDNTSWYQLAKKLANQAKEEVLWYEHQHIGYNYLMTNLNAAMGLAQFGELHDYLEIRVQSYERYYTLLKDFSGITFQPVLPNCNPNKWLPVVTMASDCAGLDPKALIKALNANRIEARYMWKPMHLQPVFRNEKSYLNGVSSHLFENGVVLPGLIKHDHEWDRIKSVLLQQLEQRDIHNEVE